MVMEKGESFLIFLTIIQTYKDIHYKGDGSVSNHSQYRQSLEIESVKRAQHRKIEGLEN
jgi:hypothetical protein